MPHPLPTHLHPTQPDILPLPKTFGLDRNLPVPARRTTVCELVVGSSGDAGGGRHRCARSDSETRGGAGEYGDDDDDDKWSGKKVRVYGRVVGYDANEGIVILSDPDSPATSAFSKTSQSSSSQSPYRQPPTIRINTAILSSHLYPFSSVVIVNPRRRRRRHARSGSGVAHVAGDESDGSEYEVQGEYKDGRPPGSRRGTTTTNNNARLVKVLTAARAGNTGGTGSRDLDSVVLDHDGDHDDDDDDVDHDNGGGPGAGAGGAGVGVGRYRAGSGRWAGTPPMTASDRSRPSTTTTTTTARGLGGKQVQGIRLDPGEAIEVVGWVEKDTTSTTNAEGKDGAGDWTIRAIHLFNVGGYVPSAPPPPSAGSRNEESKGWERRKGLEYWD